MFREKDSSDLSTEFSGRTQDNGKIQFGMRRTKRTKALLHWVHYFYLISGDPTIVEMNEINVYQTVGHCSAQGRDQKEAN